MYSVPVIFDPSADPLLIAGTILFLTCLGLVLGSFATALAHRIAQGLPWIWDREDGKASRSFCLSCKHMLGVRDLFPLFSWLLSKGRCRYCGSGISLSYPLIELASAVCCLAVFWDLRIDAADLLLLGAVPFLLAMLVIDLRHMILPDQLQLVLAGLGALKIFVLFTNGYSALGLAVEFGLGALLGTGAIWVLGLAVTKALRKDALGFGDVKFFAVAGLWLGLSHMAVFCLLSGLLGLALALIWRLAGKGPVFPFGPALIAAFFLIAVSNGSFSALFGL